MVEYRLYGTDKYTRYYISGRRESDLIPHVPDVESFEGGEDGVDDLSDILEEMGLF